MIVLALDASTYRGSVAVLRDGDVLAANEAVMRGATDERLMPAVADALDRAAVSVTAIDRVVCGAGPGSFTSLRIAAAIAKGIASARGIPLFTVPSLALAIADSRLAPGVYCLAMDALRDERYVGLYEIPAQGQITELQSARLLPAAAVQAFAANAGAKLASVAARDDEGTLWPHARAAARLAAAIERSGPVDPGAWEPSYGRLAEAQARWEAAHGRPLTVG